MDDQLRVQGMFSWNELMTQNVDSAKSFYSKLFGWEYETHTMPEETYHIIKIGDKQIGGIMAYPEKQNHCPAMWGSYVTVNNVDLLASEAEKLGGQVIISPRDIPDVGRFAVIKDNQGALITLISYLDNINKQ